MIQIKMCIKYDNNKNLLPLEWKGEGGAMFPLLFENNYI